MAGKINEDDGLLNCIHCPPGKWQEYDGKDACEQCPSGKFSNHIETRRRRLAPAGLDHDHGTADDTATDSTADATTADDMSDIMGSTSTDSTADTPTSSSDDIAAAMAGSGSTVTDDHGDHHDDHHDHAIATDAPTEDGVGYHFYCQSCQVLDELRRYWTAGVAGASTCTQKPLACNPGPWMEYGTCSQSCSNGDGANIQTRTRVPETQLPCGLASGCDQAWGGGTACDQFHYSEHQECSTERCAVDCEMEPWGAWSGCSASCGNSGHTSRVRDTKIRTEYGGKACRHRKETERCNVHDCALPYCHPSFIHCKIVLKQLGANKHFGSAMKERCQGSAFNGGIFCNRVDNLDGDHYMRDDCAHEGYAQCHNCDTADECDATGISKTVVVTHESKYALMAKQNEYKCAMDTQGDCQCACRHHIPCCTKEGFMLENPTLPGNVYTTVQDLQSCCDMCTNHPMCISFEYDSDGVCSLKSGKPRFTPQTRFVSASGSARQIWAGVRSGMQCLAEESCNCPAEDLAPSLYFKDPKEYSP